MRTQHQFDTDADRSRRVRYAVRDTAFHIVIIILSVFAMAAMAWLTFNGPQVDYHINHLIRP